MATNEPNFFQQHVEKLAMAVGLVILLASAVHFGIGTPRRIELDDNEKVPPSEVDTILLEAAKQTDRRIRAYAPEPEPIPNLLAELEALQAQPLGDLPMTLATLSAPAARGIPGINFEAPELPTLADITQAMPVPDKPLSWAGTEIIDDGDQTDLVEKPVWRFGILYDMKALNEQWLRALRSTIVLPEIISVGYDVEIQIQQPDGTWEPAPNVALTRPDEYAPPTIPAYDPQADNRTEIATALDRWRENGYAWVNYMLHPQWWEVYTEEGPGDWRTHFPVELYENFADRRAAAQPATTDEEPAPGPPAGPAGPAASPKTPVAPTGPSRTRGVDQYIDAPIVDPRWENQRPTPRRIATRTPTVGGGDIFGGEVMPTPAEQTDLGLWLVWFHTDDIKYNRPYRCRMRLKFVNPLLGHPGETDPEHKDAASVPIVTTQWSPWSEPIEAEQVREFYVTGDNRSQNTVTVTVFGKAFGQRVMKRFSGIRPGTTIGETAKVDVINPKTQEIVERDVDFSTDAIAMQFDFSIKVVTSSGITREDTEMVFLNQAGQLEQRSKYVDSDSRRYAMLLQEAAAVEELVEPAPVPETPEPRNTRRRPTRRTPTGPGPGLDTMERPWDPEMGPRPD